MPAEQMHAEKSIVPTTDATVSDSPLKLLLIPFYFSSPLNALLESLRDPDCNQVMFHDIMEAYGCFSDRIRSVAKPLMQVQTTHATHAALKIIEECSSDLVQVLKRDLRRAIASPSSQSQQSFHMYSYSSSSTSSNVYHALDCARLAQHALCLISDICIFRALYSLFSASDFQLILDDLFAFTVVPGLSMINGPKICSLIVWILRVQRLPADILLERQGDISLTLGRAITGYFGPQAVIDGLKATHTLLLQHGMSLLSPMATLLPRVLKHVTNDSLDVRLESVYALSGFAFALNSCNQTPEVSRSLRRAVQKLISNENTLLPKVVEDAASKSKPTHFGQSPCWALTLISSMIIILDYTIFFRPHCVKLCFSTLYQAANHKRPGVRALHSHVWKLLIWSYLRIPASVDKEELGDVDVSDIRKRALKVLRQESKNDIRLAFVASLLQRTASLDVVDSWPEFVENALDIIQDMLRSSDGDTRRNGVSAFSKLFVPDEVVDPKHQTRHLLCRRLFDGSLLNVNINSLNDVVRLFPTFTPDSVRCLTNEEVYDNWTSAVSTWVAITLVSLRHPELQLSDLVLSTWISLLEIFVQRCDGLTPTSSPSGLSNSIAMAARQLLDSSDKPEAQIRHLQLVKKLWSMTKSVLYDTWLPSNAEIILAAILRHNFVLNDDNVLKEWSGLCADLISVGVPTLLHVLYFQSERRERVEVLRRLWTVLAKMWQVIDHEVTWDDLVTLLVIPFGTWKLSAQEFDQWESMLRNAVRLAEYSSESDNAVVRLFIERLGNKRREVFKGFPQALCSILRQVNLSVYKKFDSRLFKLADEVLSKSYPPIPEFLATCIDLLCVVGELIATCPDRMLLELIKSTQGGLCYWIQDEDGVLLETEQNIIVDGVYCTTLNRLCHYEPTPELLHETAPLLVSVFRAKNIPPPALGPTAFENFWRMTYHRKKDFKAFCPEDIKTCLKSVSVAWGGSIGDSSGTAAESQKSIAVIPDSQCTPHNRSSSVRAFTPRSSPFDVFLSPRRRSSAPPSSPSNPLVIDSVEFQEQSSPCPDGDHGHTTPVQRSFVLSPNWGNRTSTPRVHAEETPELFKGRKRVVGSGYLLESTPAKRRRSDTGDPPQGSISHHHPPSLEKALSEPAPGRSSPSFFDNHLASQPNPSRKRKLFDYMDLPVLRNVRSRPGLDDLPITPDRWIEPTISQMQLLKSQQEINSDEGHMRQHSRRAASVPELAVMNLVVVSDNNHARRSCLPPCDPERSQSLPAVIENEEEAVRATVVAERLRDALAAYLEADGISQAPDEDLVQNLALANRRARGQATRILNKPSEQRDDG